MHGELIKQWRPPINQCEHLAGAANKQCVATARWRVSSAIGVVIGNYCADHLPKLWPGWRKVKA